MRAILVGLLLLACGGGESDGDGYSPDALSPSGGSAPTAAAGSGGQPTGEAGSAVVAGQGGAQEPAGGTGGAPVGGGAGEPTTAAGRGGTEAGGSGSGGATGGGAAGGSPPGGAGGSAGAAGKPTEPDPLEPKPAANCPGYVDILVPLNTCLWFHGEPARSVQNAACDIVDPPVSTKCSTVTATLKELTSRVSTGANFERFDVDPQTGLCPKLCN